MANSFKLPNRRAFVCGCVASIGYSALGEARAAGEENISDVEMTPFHMVAFGNDWGRFVNVRLPAGRSASWHRHTRDFVYVYLSNSHIEATVLGGAPSSAPRKVGDVVFANYAKKPLVHQIANRGESDFHLIGFEMSEPRSRTSVTKERPAPYEKVVDNERITAWRLILPPNNEAEAVQQNQPSARFVVQSGEVTEFYGDDKSHILNLAHGDYSWIEPVASRRISNTGSTTIELVEAEFK